MLTKKDVREIATGLGFLLPNILGFMTFTAVPLVISLVMAFTNWNLELHNMFKTESVQFVGFANFQKLLNEPDFFKYLGNTLFLMIGIPFGMAGSLMAAMLLNNDFRGNNKRVWGIVITTAILVVSISILMLVGMQATAMMMLICGLTGTILIMGSVGGQTIYRTLFYFPHFTAGVSTFILWKKLYSPDNGPINNALTPVLESISPSLAKIPQNVAESVSFWLIIAVAVLMIYCFWRKLQHWLDGDCGTVSLIVSIIIFSVPLILCHHWGYTKQLTLWVLAACWLGTIIVLIRGRKYRCLLDYGMTDSVIISGAIMVFALALLGASIVMFDLPLKAVGGISPPKWHTDYYWAKPSLIFMGLWGSIGSNNMLLYLAGLSGVSQELYEAADIDGASKWQRFWNITWPQLSNITFFILIMAIIGGLQGGFEMARAMTQGGPAGSTTTLSYYIYSEGFATGRLGYASAVSWALFAMVFVVTIFNWKFGNRYTND